MSEYRRLCGCIRIRWAAVIAEMVLMAISIVALTLGGLYGSVITGRSAFPIVIIHLCVYSPLIAFTAIGTAAITQRDGHGMALSIKALYINIAVIAIVEVIDIILLATSRKFAIVTECQYRNLEHTDILDYLTDPIATSLDINNSCEKFWTNALLGYILEFLISFVIMVMCVVVLRMYCKELLLTIAATQYESNVKETIQAEDDSDDDYEEEKFKSEEKFKPIVTHFEHQRHTPVQAESKTEDSHDSRSTLYSKISQKNVLKRQETSKHLLESLHPPDFRTQPPVKSPTLERMEYSSYKERGAGNVPLEREGFNAFAGDQWTSNSSENPDQEQKGLLENDA